MKYEPIHGVSVIGLVGHARHGKDEAARVLARLVAGARRYAFSDAISIYARLQHGMTQRDPVVLQDVGYQVRLDRPSAWLDAVYWQIHDHSPDLAIITGARFEDEVQMIRDMGGLIIKVYRVNEDGSEFVSGDRDRKHAVERDIDSLHHDGLVRNVTGKKPLFEQDVIAQYRRLVTRLHSPSPSVLVSSISHHV